MPFLEEFSALFNSLGERYKEDYTFTHAGDLDCQQSIIRDIVVGIEQADYIISDLTFRNPNVFYELGLAHAMGKKVIMITQSIDDLPFDIKGYKATQYSTKFYKINELYEALDIILENAKKGTIEFGNPLSDYAKNPKYKLEHETILSTDLSQASDSSLNPIVQGDNEREFLDFIADIETSMQNITDETNSITSDMNQMTNEVTHASDEINKVKVSGGDSTATFARNVSRRLSFPINTFASQLKNHSTVISNEWNVVESCYLSLLDDKRMQLNENQNGLRRAVKSLSDVQSIISEANSHIMAFLEVLNNSLGIERHLSKAITLLMSELDNYLSTSDMMVASIDRIKTKSNMLFSKTA